MRYNRLKKRPDRGALAKDVPAGGVHGYYPNLAAEKEYWEERKATSLNFGDFASFEMADSLIEDIGQLVRPAVGSIVSSIEMNSPLGGPGGEKKKENLRRDILGMVALSKLCREIVAPSQAWILDYRSLSEEEKERGPGILPEPSARDELGRTLDTRVHLSAELADSFLGRYNPNTKNPAWYRSLDGDLYIRRTPADPTTSYMGQLADRNIRVDFDEFQTLCPYVPTQRQGPVPI